MSPHLGLISILQLHLTIRNFQPVSVKQSVELCVDLPISEILKMTDTTATSSALQDSVICNDSMHRKDNDAITHSCTPHSAGSAPVLRSSHGLSQSLELLLHQHCVCDNNRVRICSTKETVPTNEDEYTTVRICQRTFHSAPSESQ